jgi:hypothetical protein
MIFFDLLLVMFYSAFFLVLKSQKPTKTSPEQDQKDRRSRVKGKEGGKWGNLYCKLGSSQT